MNFDEIRWCWFFGNPWILFVGIFLTPWLLLVFHTDGQETNLQVLCAAQAQNNETELWIRMKYCVHQQDAKKHTKHWQILDIINWRVDDVRCLNVPTMAQQQYEPLTLGFCRVSPGFAFAHLRTGEAISGNINHEHQLWMFFFAWFLANCSNTPVLIFRNTTVMNFWQDDFWTDLHRPNKSWD